VSQFVLATANVHKAQEMRAILAPLGIDLVARPSNVAVVQETEETLEGNALLKARALAAATAMAAIADDTGLFVAALDGRPGVHSARFAGEDASDEQNVAKLLEELGAVGGPRDARFATVIAVVLADGTSLCVRGELEGEITTSPRGEGGFGYDPVFAPKNGHGRTLAEMSETEKNSLSHRSRALHRLVEELAYFF
jgi:XTP/dITP diphosphohydrolase